MSVTPPTPRETARKTVRALAAAKGGTPLVCLTAYDAPMASLLDPHCDILLVGDSVGMVVHGLPSTVEVTMDMMILHARAVMRGSSQAFIVVDMPFGSYENSVDQAFFSAARIMKETGCQAVKIESGTCNAAQIAHLVARGIPVMGHVGLRPQAVNADGGFRVRGRSKQEWDTVVEEAMAADEAGAFAIVIEGVSAKLAEQITQSVSCPTIGIGASSRCDGQILVTDDMLGLFEHTPRFVRVYGDLRTGITNAVCTYARDVRARTFPAAAQTYQLNNP